MSHSRRHIMDRATVTAQLGVAASAAPKPSASRKNPFLKRMPIAAVLVLSAVLAFASPAIAQIVPSEPGVQPEPGGPLADLFPGIENLFPGMGMPGPGIQFQVGCAKADEQQHDCAEGSDVGEDVSSDSDRDGGRASVRGASRLVLRARPRSDRTLPLRFGLSGRVVPPRGLVGVAELFRVLGVDVRDQACKGRVTLAFKARGRTVVRRRASVTSTCRFRSRVTMRTRRRLGRARRLKASARFGGNRLLAPVRRSIKLRIG
jgi:hypothetical protein